MEEKITEISLDDCRKVERLPYHKPLLTGFGLISELTAAGSGTMSEEGPGTIDCSMNKSYVPVCMGL